MASITPSLAKNHVVVAEFPPMDFSGKEMSESIPKVDDKGQSVGHWLAVFSALYATQYATQVGHWHIVDPRFNDVHSFFGAEYSTWASYIDTVAEHIRTKDGFMPHTLLKLQTGLEDAKLSENTSAKDLLANYLKYLDTLTELLNNAAEDLKTLADNDLLGELARAVEKSKWKVKSIAVARIDKVATAAETEDLEFVGTDHKASRMKMFVLTTDDNPRGTSEQGVLNLIRTSISVLHECGAELVKVAGIIRGDSDDSHIGVITFSITEPAKFLSLFAESCGKDVEQTDIDFALSLKKAYYLCKNKADSFESTTVRGYKHDVRPLEAILNGCSNPKR